MKTKFLYLIFLGLFSFSNITNAQVLIVVIESTTHHLGDDTGNEGTFLDSYFVYPGTPVNAYLELDFVLPLGPNYENPPAIKINGSDIGSIQPFFPMDGFPSSGGWVVNPDNSHDYNGGFHTSLPVTSLLVNGNNLFHIENGRPDDDYFFNKVQIIDSLYSNGINSSSPNLTNIFIYPNPSTGKFTITFPSTTKQIKISNSLGQVLQTKDVFNEKSKDFELTDNGIYLIEIKADKQTLTKKLIICK